MEIPAFLIFDCDGDKLTHKNPDNEKAIRKAHERDNKALFMLTGTPAAEPFPVDAVWGNNFAAWPFDLAQSIKIDADVHWDTAGSSASATFGGAGGLQKNTLHIGARLMELQKLEANTATIDRLCEAIVTFASQP